MIIPIIVIRCHIKVIKCHICRQMSINCHYPTNSFEDIFETITMGVVVMKI